MAVEIGTLVLRGQFGPTSAPMHNNTKELQTELDLFRRMLLREINDILAESDRRARER